MKNSFDIFFVKIRSHHLYFSTLVLIQFFVFKKKISNHILTSAKHNIIMYLAL